MTFREQLKKLDACRESLEWVEDKTIEEAWETCKNSEWMLWILSKTGLDLIDPLCAIAGSVLHLVPENNRLVYSNAISAARRRANIYELNDAHDAAYERGNAAANVAAYAAAYASYANATNISSAVGTAAAYVAHVSAQDAASYAASVATSAAYAAAYAADQYSACGFGGTEYAKERQKQCDILRKYFTIDQVKEAFNKLVA